MLFGLENSQPLPGRGGTWKTARSWTAGTDLGIMLFGSSESGAFERYYWRSTDLDHCPDGNCPFYAGRGTSGDGKKLGKSFPAGRRTGKVYPSRSISSFTFLKDAHAHVTPLGGEDWPGGKNLKELSLSGFSLENPQPPINQNQMN